MPRFVRAITCFFWNNSLDNSLNRYKVTKEQTVAKKKKNNSKRQLFSTVPSLACYKSMFVFIRKNLSPDLDNCFL